MALRVCFYRNTRPREYRISSEMGAGVAAHGDEFQIRAKSDYGKGRKYEGPDGSYDVMMCYGVKSRDLIRDHVMAGVPYVLCDKGYIRRPGPFGVEKYTRVTTCELYPLTWFQKEPRPSDRFDELNIRLQKRRGDGPILVAGSSQKFYDFHGVGREGRFHSKLIRRVKGFAFNREVVFRPKPSYEKRSRKERKKEPAPAYGANRLSTPGEKIRVPLDGAHCLVTYASNAACDAIFNGIPVVVLGPHITVPVAAGNQIEDIPLAELPSDDVVRQWAYDLAYEQYTIEEMREGFAWSILRPRVIAGYDAIAYDEFLENEFFDED